VIAELIPSGDQSDGGSDIAALCKTLWIFEDEIIRQGSNGPYAADLSEQLCLGIFDYTQLLNELVVFADQLGEVGDRFKDWKQSWLKCFWDKWAYLGSEIVGGAGRQTSTGAFHDSANVIDE